MKTVVLILALICCSITVLFAQQRMAAGGSKSQLNHAVANDHPDTTAAAILRDWFRPLEHPDKNFLKKQQATPTKAPVIKNLQHTILHYSKDTYCGHPRMVNFNYYPPNE